MSLIVGYSLLPQQAFKAPYEKKKSKPLPVPTRVEVKAVSVIDHLKASKENFHISEETISYVRENVPISPNNLARSVIDYEKEGLSKEAFLNLCSNTADLISKRIASLPSEESLKELNSLVLESGIGYCADMAVVGYFYLKEKYPGLKVEIFDIENGDHVFLVIGRNPDSKPEDYKNWGPSCFVCDPWLGKTIPASKIEEELMDNQGSEIKDFVTYPILQRFNPKTQKLKLRYPQETSPLQKKKDSSALWDRVFTAVPLLD